MSVSPADRAAGAADGRAVVDAVLDGRSADARLYAVDHATERLVHVAGASGETQVALVDELRDAVLLGVPATVDGVTWTPILERSQTVFVIAESSDSARSPQPGPGLGLVLRNQRRRFEDMDRGRRRRSMSVEAELQWDLLPERADVLGDHEVAGVLEPAYDVAGDLFDYSLTGDSTWAYSLDGMGHGLDATITGVLALTAIRNSRREGGSLVEQMASASRLLAQQYGGDRFVTAVGVRIGADGAVEIVNAGHEPVRAWIGHEVVRPQLDAQFPLGVDPDHTYVAQDGPQLDVGDAIVLLSDGPGAARSQKGETFGGHAVDAAIAAHAREPMWKMAHGMMGDVLDFIGDGDVIDDMTMVALRRREAPRV